MAIILHKLKDRRFILWVIIFGVFANGLLTVGSTLAEVLMSRNGERLSDALPSVPLLIGITLIYLATLLARRKRAAWLIIVPVYGFSLGVNLAQVILVPSNHHMYVWSLLHKLVLPAIVVYGLWHYRKEFRVKSDIQNFTLALRTCLLLLTVALAYGVIGFMLLDTRDFHQEINFIQALHRTVDQFNFTEASQLITYTRRSRLFLDSLSIISLGTAVYVFVSLFQPLRSRISDQARKREHMDALLRRHPTNSEDFFKLWPHDKSYFFNGSHTAGVAYRVHRGVALVVGDPLGKTRDFPLLMDQFLEFCRVNDWLPAFVHTANTHQKLYESHDFALQKIGEEAILDISHFVGMVAQSKYFRQIGNRFAKQGYSVEHLMPPHNQAVLNRLQDISGQWLTLPGRTERGFMMGFYSDTYMQLCPIAVLRDGAGTIQAFINRLPYYGSDEANYDLLRYTELAPTNSNDFLLMSFITRLSADGFKTLNMGLCPLAGLDSDDHDRTLIDNALRFMYTNGDRLYSFSGLRRFKAKYEPNWESRYVAYRGGIRGFTRSVTALNKIMNNGVK